MAVEVSVIIPTYNRAALLCLAIQSVLDQVFQDFELIIVDDGSTDETGELVSKIEDPRICYFRQPNRGRSAARNQGVVLSSGQYLAFLDDDDEFLPGKLEKQVAFLDSNSGVGLVAGGHEFIDADGNSLGFSEPWYRNPDLEVGNWLMGCPFLLQSIVIRRSWWDIVGGLDIALPQAHDHDLFLRLAQSGCEMCWIHEHVFRYRMHSQNISRNAYTQTLARIQMLEKFFRTQSIQLCASVSYDEHQLLGYHWALGAMHAYAVGQINEAKESLLQAIRYDQHLTNERIDVLIEHITEVANSPLNLTMPREYIISVFNNLPEELSYLQKYKRVALARLSMRRFFEGHEKADSRAVLSAFLPGILLEPKWIRNRGVWSILISAILRLVLPWSKFGISSQR